MSNSIVPLPAQPTSRSTQVVGTVAVADGHLAVDLAPAHDSTRTAVVRPVGSPFAGLPPISHWYLDQQGVTALLAFAVVTALCITLGWWV